MIYQQTTKEKVCKWYNWPLDCLDYLPFKAWQAILIMYENDEYRGENKLLAKT